MMWPRRHRRTHARMSIVAHESASVDCCGCVIAAAEGSTVELRCNECGAVVGVVLIDVLRALIRLDE